MCSKELEEKYMQTGRSLISLEMLWDSILGEINIRLMGRSL